MRILSGKGGDGAIGFEKGPKLVFGPPNGGNGGAGGDVYVIASKSETTLNSLESIYKSSNGDNGGRQNLHGKRGKSIDITVPLGTTVRQVEMPSHKLHRQQRLIFNNNSSSSGESEQYDKTGIVEKNYKFRTNYFPQEDRLDWLISKIPLARPPPPPISLDLMEDGERVLILRGGRFGFGNPHFASQEIRGPPFALKGEPGSEVWVEFELKSIADVGLVGLPNAGKSTFLAAVSRALPKIGNYPFTTLNPYIGTIDFPDYWSMTVADLPGIIQGAHKNIGLGHTFLRHIERSKVLVYIIDVSGPAPWTDLKVLQSELSSYRTDLLSRPSIVIANKADNGNSAKDNLEVLKSHTTLPIILVSAKHKVNINLALDHIRAMVEHI